MRQKKHLKWAIRIFTVLVGFVLVACGEKSRIEDVQEPRATDSEIDLELWQAAKSPVVDSEPVDQQVNAILAKMTLEEKVGQITQAEIQSIQPGDVKKYHIGSVLNGGGSVPERKAKAGPEHWLKFADRYYEESVDTSDGFLAIPVIWGTDAVHGHGNVSGATLFPHNIGLGATRNVELVKRIGEATAREVRATGMEWIFAPTVAVAQNDLWGRTYESYSEDPDLVAQFALALVEGMQGKVGSDEFLNEYHTLATAKHFLADGGTANGNDQGDAQISEKELVQVHSPGYVSTINAGVQSVMSSFSSWNGEKVHGNKYLLTDKLRGPLGFDGVVVGDWDGHGQVPGCSKESCAKAVNAGVDLIMVPNDWKAFIKNTLAQVKSGEISLERLDEAVKRILRMKIRVGLFNGKKPSERLAAADVSVVGSAQHREIARQSVRESLVLLKNAGSMLPLKPAQHFVVSGNAADKIANQSGGWSVSWQATGLSNSDFPGATSIFAGIKQTVENAGGSVELSLDGEYKQKPDAAIVVFGELPYAEGRGDLNTLEFEPGDKQSLALLKKFRQAGVPVVSVFISGRPMWINPEYNQSNAFVAAWLPGTEGQGVADVLFANKDGSVNFDFKGSLSFSWPKTPLQTKLNRHHENYEPLFALGYGLNYAENREGPVELQESVEGLAALDNSVVDFYVGRPLQPWIVFVGDAKGQQVLSGAYAAVPSGRVKLETADKDLQEDALRFTWKDARSARLFLQDGPALDLSDYREKGIYSFDLKVNDIAKGEGGLAVASSCGNNCLRSVSLNNWVWNNSGRGWQSLSVPISCFIQDGDDFTSVARPFSLQGGGTGDLEIANIRIHREGDANISCPKRDQHSVSPETLNEFWSVKWWGKRHQDKLTRASEGDVDLLFVGDSITQGWENEGKKVWEKYYASRKAFNIGFSGDRTENVIWRLENGEVDGISPKVAVLMIGTNNTGHRLERPIYTANGVRKILDTLKQKLPETKILLLAIFPRSEQSYDFQRVHNEKINKLISAFADNKSVFYLDINKHFIDDNGVLSPKIMPDMLHPNEAGYAIWAEKMEPTLRRLLAK